MPICIPCKPDQVQMQQCVHMFMLIQIAVEMTNVKVVSASSVRVTWVSVDIPEITNYTVYYQTGNMERESVTVPSTTNSKMIEGLVTNEEYQFQVAATVLDGGVATEQNISTPTTIIPTENLVTDSTTISTIMPQMSQTRVSDTSVSGSTSVGQATSQTDQTMLSKRKKCHDLIELVYVLLLLLQ